VLLWVLFATPHPGRRLLRFSPPLFLRRALGLGLSDVKLRVMKTSPPLLDLRNISVVRGGNLALNRFSLRIDSGEHVCILGPNGCGKSTLIKTITRECYPLESPETSMSILGRSIWNIFELRPLLGIVSPDLLAACTSDASCLDVVLSGFFSSTRIFPNHQPLPEHQERAKAALVRMGIEHLAHRPLLEMSSGEVKRTLIARALVHNPQTLLLDEPGNTLDIAGQVELREIMRELAQEGIGMLLVTHHISEIVPEIERVILLQRGAVLADGPKEKLLTSEQLSALFEVPVRVIAEDGYYHLHA
jgi:iron complex transport system ATP-binding protein